MRYITGVQLVAFGFLRQPPGLVKLGDAVVADAFRATYEGDDLPCSVTVTVRVDQNGPRITDMSLSGRSITTADLRSIPLGRIRDAATVLASARFVADEDGTVTGGAFPGPPAATRAALRRQRRVIDQEHLREVAAVYQRAPTAPTAAVAVQYGVPRATAARWVSSSRRAGLLPPPAHKGRDPR